VRAHLPADHLPIVKYAHLIWAAFRRKPTRTVLTSLSIITAFFLFGTLVGMNAGVDSLVDNLKGTHLRVSSRFNLAEPLPVAHVARIEAVPGVASVAPLAMLIGNYQRPGNVVPIIAVDIAALDRIYDEITVPPDELATVLRTRTGVVIGRQLATNLGLKIGDRMPVRTPLPLPGKDWVFDIVGVYDQDPPEMSTWVLANYEYVNEGRTNNRDTVNQILVGIGDAARAAEVSQAIDDLFANSPHQTVTQTEKDFIQSTMRRIGDINFLVNAIVGAVLFTLLFLTANTMAQSVRERIPEIAVLKTVGFSDGAVQALVLVEALLLCFVAAILGLWLASMALPAITNRPALGMGPMQVPVSVYALGAAIALIIALVSGVPLARRAGRVDIAAALAKR
jgi:putative ABC transport system permease protein